MHFDSEIGVGTTVKIMLPTDTENQTVKGKPE
jgi:hypothetical protein